MKLSCSSIFLGFAFFGIAQVSEAQSQTVAPDREVIQEAIEDKKVDPVYAVAEVMPEFEGGELALIPFLESQIQYPKDAMEAGIMGTVYVRFVVSSTGEVHSFEVLRSVSGVDSLAKEAIRVAKLTAGKWKPGKQAGKAVDVYRTLPVRFAFK